MARNTKSASNARMQATPDPNWTFRQLLDWHVRRGTRPAGSPQSVGVPWENKEFARAVGAKSTESEKNERTIRNWRNGDTLPGSADLHGILQALFGGRPEYADWQSALSEKYHAALANEEDEAETTVAPRNDSIPTRPLRCLGRDEDLKSVVDALIGASDRAAVLVLGTAGMGKTTLTRQAATDDAVLARFGGRRWFVELETATDAQTFETAIVAALGLDPTAAKFDAALVQLAQGPGLLILDNLETPWEGDRSGIEQRLALLAAVPKLVLLVSIRGNEPPAGLRWTRQRTMHPLEAPHDRDLFLDIAQDIKPDDPHLAPLLADLGGVPLAIELVAMQAAPHDTLAALHAEWQRAGTALARRRGVEPSRLTSLEKSLELSFASPRLTDAGRRLFSILGQLPAGICAEDLNSLLGESAFEARQGLLASGLGFERGGRLDLLPPVRDHVMRLHPPASEDAARWRNYFLKLAGQQGERFNTPKGSVALARLAAELPNLDAAVRAAMRAKELQTALVAQRSIGIAIAWTGTGTPAAIHDLAAACRAAKNSPGEASCI